MANSDKGHPGLPRDNIMVRRRSNTEHNHTTNGIKEAMAMMNTMEVLVRDMEDNTKTRATAEEHLPTILMDVADAQCPVRTEGQFLAHKRLIRIVVHSALLPIEEVQVQACQMDILRRMVCVRGRMLRIQILQVSPLHITACYPAH